MSMKPAKRIMLYQENLLVSCRISVISADKDYLFLLNLKKKQPDLFSVSNYDSSGKNLSSATKDLGRYFRLVNKMAPVGNISLEILSCFNKPKTENLHISLLRQ